jgi:RNA recognition motif-containing protein
LSYLVFKNLTIIAARRNKLQAILVKSKEKIMATKLYVGGLAYETTEKELEELFAAHGTVESVAIIMDRDTNRSKGFGFVEMSSAEEAQKAITELNGKELGGRKLMVNQARPKEDRPSGGGGGFRRSY